MNGFAMRLDILCQQCPICKEPLERPTDAINMGDCKGCEIRWIAYLYGAHAEPLPERV